MDLEKFGRAGLFVVFLIVFLAGASMLKKLAMPTLKKYVPSLADALA